jgi:hypothetical protein
MRRWRLLLGAIAAGCGPGPGGPAVCDRDALLAAGDRVRLDERAWLIERESGVHVAYRLGAEAGALPADGRGIAFHYDRAQERLRVDLGYALEPLIPDARAGDWIDATLRPLFEAGRPATALLLATRMLHHELRESQLRAPLEPAALPQGSGGAGAEGAVRLADEIGLPEWPSPDARALPGPGASAGQAYESYLCWLERRRFEPDAALFTPATREFLASWPMTPGYLEHIREREAGQAHAVLERGDRAILYFTGDPLLAPHFFVRTAQGWQMDLAAETELVIGIAGGPYAWGLRSSRVPALAPFADKIVSLGGFLRLRGGDNRRLEPPSRADPQAPVCAAG